MEERRKLDRFGLALPAILKTLPEWSHTEPTILRAHTLDISSGGAFFYTLTPLPKGTRVRIELILKPPVSGYFRSRKSVIEVSGRVLRSKPVGMAVAFDTRYRIRSLADS